MTTPTQTTLTHKQLAEMAHNPHAHLKYPNHPHHTWTSFQVCFIMERYAEEGTNNFLITQDGPEHYRITPLPPDVATKVKAYVSNHK